MKTSRFSPFSACLSCLALSLALICTAQAAGRKNPTSKVFVAETKGETLINNGEKIEPLTVNSAYSIEGSTIETKADATATLVFSNGNSITLNPNSRLEVKKFLQEPFTPNRNDLDVEPSISQTVLNIARGSFSACSSRMVAGSSLTYLTPHGTFNIRGRKVLVEATDSETVVSVLEGDITAIDPATGSSQTLKPGQQAVLRRTAPDQPATIAVNNLTPEATTKADDQISLACMARRTVYFETVDRDEIRPVQIRPTGLPTQFTVSPSRTTR